MTPVQKELLQELQTFAQSAPTAESLMEQIAKRLHEKMTRYNWTGFYLVDPADPGYLIVGPFAGSFTPHARLRCGRHQRSGCRRAGCLHRSALSCRVVAGKV